VAESIVTLRVNATQATQALQGVQTKTTKLQGAFGALKTAIVGVGLTALAKQAVSTSTNFEKLNVRLGLLTKANGTFAASQKIATDAQKAFGLSATEALEGITDITARLAPLGVGVEDIKSTFFGFNTAAKLAGASTIEASNAFRQLAQALGSGRLAGDEFRSISEQIPTLLQPIAKELDVPIGKLKELAAEGQLTSEVVLRALRTIETDGAASLKALIENDPTQVFKDLSNEAENLSRAVGDLLVPAVIPAVKGLTALTKAAVDFVNSPIGKTAALFTGIALAIKGATVAIGLITAAMATAGGVAGVLAIAMNAIPFVALITAAGLLTTAFFKLNGEKKKFNNLLNEGQEDEVTQALRDQAKAVGELHRQHEKAKGRDKRGLKRKLKEAELELKMLEGRLQTVKSDQKIEEAANNIVALKKEQNKQNTETVRLTDIQRKHHMGIVAEAKKEMDAINDKKNKFNDFLNKQEKSKELLEASINGNREEVELQHAINDAVAIHGEQNRQKITDILTANKGLEDQAKKTKEVGTAAESLKEKFKQIGETVRTDLVNNLTDAITGAKSFGDAMKNVLNNLKRQIIQLALNRSISAIGKALMPSGGGGGFFSGLFGKRAAGGPVSAGGAYVVGERGPELLQMGSKGGNIIPNNKIGGGDSVTNVITVNVDANSSNVTGNNADANQLGNQIAVAIQSELIKQKRAGGLLA
jgi:tape measure domain-containing protein